MKHRWVPLAGVVLGLACFPADGAAQFPVGWSQVPNTKLRPLQQANGRPLGNFAGMLDAWVGAAVDTRRGWWVVPLGGGHQDWAGNESYVVDLVTRSSSVLVPISPNARLGVDCADRGAEEPDPGRPSARHTYDQVVYAEVTDEVWVFFGAQECLGGYPSHRLWRLGLKTRTWTGFAPPGSGGTEWKGANMVLGMDHAGVTAYDRVSQKIYYHNRTQMFAFDPRTTKATQIGEGVARPLNQTGVIDPWRRKFVIMGNAVAAGGGLILYDLAKNSYLRPATTEAQPGDRAPETAAAPGLAYDPVTTRIVAWTGGPRLHFLDLDSGRWSSEALPLNGGMAAPMTPQNGTFSKFDFAPHLGCLVAVASVDSDLYIACPSTAHRLPPRITIPLQTFWAAPRPPAGVGPAGPVKHSTYAHNPLDGRLYQFGGDFTEVSPTTGRASNQSYMQSAYSLSVYDKWVRRNDPAAGWRQEWPFCGPPGSLQPKYPDYVGWAWDPRTRRFVTTPGTYDVNANPDYRCPSQTAARASDPLFKASSVMAFDPARPPHQRWSLLSADAGAPGGDGPWMGALDPVTARVYRFSASHVQYFDLLSNRWGPARPLPPNGVGQPIRIWKEQLALDELGRAIYAIDGFAGRLMRYPIDTGRMEDLGPVPGGQLADGATSNDALVAWDSTHDVLAFFRHGDRTIHVYDPATGRWSSPPVVLDGASAVDVRHAFAYDPYQNVFVLVGTTDPSIPHLFFWRYADPRSTPATRTDGSPGAAPPSAPPARAAAPAPDAGPPTVSLTAPSPGATVSGSVVVTATATDDQGVAGVQFAVDGARLGAEVTTEPYSVLWHTAPSGSGRHVLTAVARDAAGHTRTSSAVAVTTEMRCPCTLWPRSTRPEIESDPDTQAVELGVKFTVDVDGAITALRFYKGPHNLGPHVGSLWTADGRLLARAAYAKESASGWQEQILPAPVSVVAGTVYVASYHTTVGRYAATAGYFSGNGAHSSPLHAAASPATAGGNGVFRYSDAPVFPDATFGGNNYWVDVVFVPK